MMHGGVECLAVFDAFSVLRQAQITVDFGINNFQGLESSPTSLLVRCSNAAGVIQQTFDEIAVAKFLGQRNQSKGQRGVDVVH